MAVDLETRPGRRLASLAGAAPVSRAAPAEDQTHRILTLLAVLGLFGVAFATWSTIIPVPATGVASVIGFGAGLALTVACLVVREDTLVWVDRAVLLLGLALLVAWAASNLYARPGYGTDEAAFEQYAARLLLHGHDPYGANLAPALSLYRVPIQYATYLLGGGVAHTLGYPALPVLLVAAFIPITHGVQSVIAADVVALAATVVLMFALLPRAWRGLSVLVPIGLPILFGYSMAGVNAIEVAALLVVVAHRWTRVGSGGRLSRGDWARSICLGLAVSTQQLAWLIAPFVVLGIYLLRRSELGPGRAAAVCGRYVAGAAATFAVLNGPFVLWGPRAWLSGVLAPITQHAIPYGQGVVDVSLFFHLGGGDLAAYSVAGLLGLLGLLVLYGVWFRRLGRAAFVLPTIALFFTTRSLAEYVMTLVAVFTVSLVTTSGAEFDRASQVLVAPRWPAGVRAAVAVLVLAPCAGALGVALATPAPLAIEIVGVQTNGQLQSVWQVIARVTNRSSHRLAPEFATNYMGQATSFYHRLSGPRILGPGRTARYVLDASNHGSMPGVTTPFLLQAVTQTPATISSSRVFVPQPYAAEIEPSYVDKVLAPGASVTFQVQLRSTFGGDVHRRGVTVALGQLIYGQSALIPSEAVIDGAPQGETPVYATTNRAGIATFHVSDASPQDQPIYFQSWIDAAAGYPFGYSSIVSVLWGR